MLRYCANLKAIGYKSTSLNRIVADKSHFPDENSSGTSVKINRCRLPLDNFLFTRESDNFTGFKSLFFLSLLQNL